MKEIEELMKPRFKVIADWPFNNLFKVGDILTFFKAMDGENKEYWYHHDATHQNFQDSWFDTFPHLFKPLQWWEEREISDLPVFLKWQNNGKVRKMKQYHKGFWPMAVEFEGGRIRALKSEWTPCTEQEYQSYQSINSLK